jgi:hypothetical protein
VHSPSRRNIQGTAGFGFLGVSGISESLSEGFCALAKIGKLRTHFEYEIEQPS